MKDRARLLKLKTQLRITGIYLGSWKLIRNHKLFMQKNCTEQHSNKYQIKPFLNVLHEKNLLTNLHNYSQAHHPASLFYDSKNWHQINLMHYKPHLA